jgi:hypothetical protein
VDRVLPDRRGITGRGVPRGGGDYEFAGMRSLNLCGNAFNIRIRIR